LNGYFTVPNFIVHAADDRTRVLRGSVGNLAETDVLAIRMPYSVEQTASLFIANDPMLVESTGGKFDVVIAEVKSGANNRPNSIWRNGGNISAIEYLVRFVGLFRSSSDVNMVARELANHYCFVSESCRIRYVVFSQQENQHYAKLGIQYLTFTHMAKFLVEVRGQCWIESELGVASSHPQWDSLLIRIFQIANDASISVDQRRDRILTTIAEPQI